MNEVSCTDFVMEGDELDLCRCPACSGFLPRHFPIGGQFQCKRCGAVLETLPSPVDDPDEEEDSDMEFGGRICEVPDYAVKILVVPYPRPREPRRHKTNKWAIGEKFIRRVWKDVKGEFITIAAPGSRYRVALDDPRILRITEGAKFK